MSMKVGPKQIIAKRGGDEENWRIAGDKKYNFRVGSTYKGGFVPKGNG
jgi:hypothetical protein